MRKVRALVAFLGRESIALFLVGQLFSLLVAGVEYCIAIFLVVFLYTLHLVPLSQIPAWLPFDVASLSSTAVWGGFLLIAGLQACFQIVVFQSKITFTEGAHARMSSLLGHLLLQSARSRYLPLSEANHLTAEVFPKATSFLFYLSQFVSFLLRSVAIIAMMSLLAPWETLIGMGGLVLMGSSVLLLNRVTNRISAEVPLAQARLERSKTRIAANRLLIKVLRMERRELGTYLDSAASYYRHSVGAYFFGNVGGAVIPVLGIVLIAIIVMAGLANFATPAASLVAFLYLFVRFEQMVANGSNLVGGLFSYGHQIDTLVDLISSTAPLQREVALADAPSLSLRKERTLGKHVCPVPIAGPSAVVRPRTGSKALSAPTIELKGLSFAWQPNDEPLFRNLWCSVDAGSQLAIVGPNGCGKSTLLSIILGTLEADTGEALVGHSAAKEYVNHHADAVAFVGAEPFLINGSVRENLRYGLASGSPDAALWRSLSEVGLAEFVRKLPGALEYMVEESGDGLSTGQKQRISIARALLRSPRLLVLDEPFANLDQTAASSIAERLQTMKRACTVVIVSHEPRMLRAADALLDLDSPQSPAMEGSPR